MIETLLIFKPAMAGVLLVVAVIVGLSETVFHAAAAIPQQIVDAQYRTELSPLSRQVSVIAQLDGTKVGLLPGM